MTLIEKTPGGSRASVFIVLALLTGGTGCGEDFKNEPRAPVPLELTGVIRPRAVTVSPDEVRAGPVLITISNQTDRALTLTLEGHSVREEVGPVNPRDTATIQQTLTQGTYELRAESDEPQGRQIASGRLRVGSPRDPSNDRILLP